MDFCYPSDTDWGCKFAPDKIAEMRSNPVTLKAMERSEALAWYTLASLTGYQVGVCPIIVRPCAASAGRAGSWMAAPVSGGNAAGLPTAAIGTFSPYLSGGEWYNACGCSGPGSCGCDQLSQVELPGPIGSIERVVVSGEVIDPSRYRVDNANMLVSLDPDLRWPVRQNMAAGPDDIGAFSVAYYQGTPPSTVTRYCAGLLAAEFYAACTGGTCKLPAGVTTLARQGVTFEIETGLFENGYTGIRPVDALIRMLNPNKLQRPVTVTSPDVGDGGRRQTWGGW